MLPGQRTAGKSKKPSGRTVVLEMPKEEGPPQTPDGEANGNERPSMSLVSTPSPTFHREVSVSRDDASWSFERIERRPRSAARRKGGARAKNPFIEYDVREKRLNQERKWLQEDSRFLEQRREELRLGALLNQLNLQNDPDDQLYENRTFYGPHSMAMKATKARRNHRGRPRTNSAPIPERPPKEAVGGRKFPKAACKGGEIIQSSRIPHGQERATAALKSLSQAASMRVEDLTLLGKSRLQGTAISPSLCAAHLNPSAVATDECHIEGN
ncbi:unnamed protein product [Symbiodinium sp. CCMP2592]|nr:unnamed protein product [Symbiodinium sp. CCMP2592]